mmetsp:Transcript_8889/g.6234  ORF Transcript_8889/g.6234 Transcript_8889/m.6234 type:complete len:135 (+) Transcript_8889:45-449(+)
MNKIGIEISCISSPVSKIRRAIQSMSLLLVDIEALETLKVTSNEGLKEANTWVLSIKIEDVLFATHATTDNLVSVVSDDLDSVNMSSLSHDYLLDVLTWSELVAHDLVITFVPAVTDVLGDPLSIPVRNSDTED